MDDDDDDDDGGGYRLTSILGDGIRPDERS